MNRREPMKNLWMKSAPDADPAFIHKPRLRIRHFVPNT
jgi:hypothetical protein